jgi:hypothetical protein
MAQEDSKKDAPAKLSVIRQADLKPYAQVGVAPSAVPKLEKLRTWPREAKDVGGGSGAEKGSGWN